MTGRRVTFIDEAPKASATGTTRGDEPSIESTIAEDRRPSARQSPGFARRLSSAAWDFGSNLLRPAFRPSNKVRTSERGSIESLRGQRRHTVSALANSASNFVPGKNSNPNSPNGSNGADGLEPHETFETRDSGQITLEIHQDVDELQLLSEALDNNHQANVRRRIKEALTRVKKNVTGMNFMAERTQYMTLKMIRAENWQHSKEVRKKATSVFGATLSMQKQPLDKKKTDYWTAGSLIALCILVLISMIASGGHPMGYSDFEHVHSVGVGHPYTVPIKKSPVNVVQFGITKNKHPHEDGFVSLGLRQYSESAGEDVVIGSDKHIDLSVEQQNTFHVRFFPVADLTYDKTRGFNATVHGPYNSTAENVSLKIHIQQIGPLGAFQEYIACAVLLMVLFIIALELLDRTLAAMVGASIMLGLLLLLGRAPTLKTILSWCDEGTLGLLFGMMVIVGKLSITGVMDVLTIHLIQFCHGSKHKLLYILCALTAVMSAFLDNVTTVLLVAPLTVNLSKSLKISPLPYLMGEVLFSNIGGTATLIGDPPNVIVGSRLSDDLTFTDFLISLGPGVIIMSIPCMYIIVQHYKEDLQGELMDVKKVLEGKGKKKKEKTKIKDPVLFRNCMIVLGMVLLGFLLHPVHHVNPAWVAILGAVVLLVFSSPHDIEHSLESVEWSTLLFFASLFIMVEAMAEVGLISTIGDRISEIIEGVDEDNRKVVAIVLVTWISAIVSAFLDNIPYTATMVPVIKQLASNPKLGLSIKCLAWSLCFGACLGGNGSLMGASANIVVAGIASKSGHPLSFKSFLVIGFQVMLVSVTVSTAYMILIYGDVV